MKKAILVLLLLTVAACSTPSWTLIGGQYTPASKLYHVTLPQGWMKFKTDQYVLLTRDGVLLQNVLIKALDDASVPAYGKRRLEPDMTASGIAQWTLEDIKANPVHSQVTVLENRLLTSPDRKGFFLLYTFNNPDGLIYQNAHYGIIGKKAVYHLIYMAPQRYYFNRDLKTFEAIVESFSLQSQ